GAWLSSAGRLARSPSVPRSLQISGVPLPREVPCGKGCANQVPRSIAARMPLSPRNQSARPPSVAGSPERAHGAAVRPAETGFPRAGPSTGMRRPPAARLLRRPARLCSDLRMATPALRTTALPADLEEAIQRLKREQNAVLLAHYYQDDAIQDL